MISEFPEHDFLKNCISCGFTVNDLEKLSFVSVFKVILSFVDISEEKIRYATQEDWDRLAM